MRYTVPFRSDSFLPSSASGLSHTHKFRTETPLISNLELQPASHFTLSGGGAVVWGQEQNLDTGSRAELVVQGNVTAFRLFPTLNN